MQSTALRSPLNERAPFAVARAIVERKPSGRLLDPGSDAGTRGMIAACASLQLACGTESGLQARPL